MDWVKLLLIERDSVVTSLLVLGLVIASGLAVGGLRYRGIKLGVAGVLFSGLIFGHFALTLNPTVLEFVREFGLILFVYAVGLTVGPGFFNALKAYGLKLNLLAASVVLLGVLTTLVISSALGVARPIAVGMFSGATTNTPSLAAAGQTIRERPLDLEEARAALSQAMPEDAARLLNGMGQGAAGETQLRSEVAKMPGLGYAVTYPFGVIGIILTMVLLRRLLRADPAREAAALERLLHPGHSTLSRMALRVNNPNLSGISLAALPAVEALHVVISRVRRGDDICVARPDFRLAVGDVLLAVGPHEQLDELRMIVGERVDDDTFTETQHIIVRWVAVTHKKIVGQTIAALQLAETYGVRITRVRRADVELPPLSDVTLGLGDHVFVVGSPEAVARVSQAIGDRPEKLEEPELIPIFIGIALGVLLGSWPIWLPGMPSPVKLGLAGGPLLVAILLSRFQRVGPIVLYLPSAANLMMKDLGIAMFLAAVGLKSGDRFIATLTQGDGLWWMLYGAAITLIPLLVVAGVARWALKVDYLPLTGLLAGSMTDPPALAFANMQSNSQIPSISYATVYPLTMILRVLSAQLMLMF